MFPKAAEGEEAEKVVAAGGDCDTVAPAHVVWTGRVSKRAGDVASANSSMSLSVSHTYVPSERCRSSAHPCTAAPVCITLTHDESRCFCD